MSHLKSVSNEPFREGTFQVLPFERPKEQMLDSGHRIKHFNLTNIFVNEGQIREFEWQTD